MLLAQFALDWLGSSAGRRLLYDLLFVPVTNRALAILPIFFGTDIRDEIAPTALFVRHVLL